MSSHSSQQQNLILSGHAAPDHVWHLSRLNEILLTIKELEGHLDDERDVKLKARYNAHIENLKNSVISARKCLENKVVPTNAAVRSLEQRIETIHRDYENDSGYYQERVRATEQQKRIKQEAMEAKRLNRQSNSSISAMFASTSSESLYLPPGRKMSPEEFRHPQNYFHTQAGTGSSAIQPSHPRNKQSFGAQEYPPNYGTTHSVPNQGTQIPGQAVEEQSASTPHGSVELANSYPGPYVRPGDDTASYTGSSLDNGRDRTYQRPQANGGFNFARNIDPSRGHHAGEA